MNPIRKYIVCILFLWPLLAMSQSCDFELRNFRTNLTDLTAVSTNIKDLNGVTTALIRFAVRDTLFQMDTNLGFLRQEKRIGEILLYVPQGVKRLTIRHPYLGTMRDFHIPVNIESKVTYDVDVVITNEDYLHALFGAGTISPTIKKVDELPVVPQPQQPKPQEQPKPQKKPFQFPDTHFMVGAGFNALSVMGPSVNVGVEIGRFMVSADYTIGIEKVEGVGIFYKPQGGSGILGEAYDYSSGRLSLRLGFNATPDAVVQIVPQLGVSFNMISGSEVSKAAGVETQFSKANPPSALVAVCLRVKLTGPLSLNVTPQYDFVVGKDAVFDVIKAADSKIKSWGEGFGVNVGLLLRF